MLMVKPTAAQQAAMDAGQHLMIVGGHSVGVPDGGPGLPFLTWSTTGGDLRIPHFIGIHALQLLPLLSILFVRRFTEAVASCVVWVAAGGYASLLALLTWQALRAQPLLWPDVVTLAALGALLLATLGSGFAVARRAKA